MMSTKWTTSVKKFDKIWRHKRKCADQLHSEILCTGTQHSSLSTICAPIQPTFYGTNKPAPLVCRITGRSDNRNVFRTPMSGTSNMKFDGLIKFYCNTTSEPPKKPSLVQRFKQMYKDYWYILLPVHCITSTIWFGSFYYMVKSGIDIASLLETIGAGETLVAKLRNTNSSMGYLAVSYALYKIATPARYTVTLGGTTLSIKYLRDWGYIKPLPPRDKIKELIHERKEILKEKKEDFKKVYHEKGFINRILTKLKLKKKNNDPRDND